MTTIRHSHTASSPPKPPRRLPRSTSDPAHISTTSPGSVSNEASPRQQIYVLSADGSSLFLLDPSKPSGNEEPPPYAPFTTEVDLSRSSSEGGLHTGVNSSNNLHHAASAAAGPSSPRGALNPVPFPSLILPETHSRHRASTLSTLNQDASPTLSNGRPRVMNHNSFSHIARTSNSERRGRRSQSVRSSPGVPSAPTLADERTPLLGDHAGDMDGDDWVEVDWQKRRGFWRAVTCGELEEGDVEYTWKAGWKRFWRPVGTGRYWKAMVHLWFLNFPFALLVWPPLVVGTLAGTALLITLPLGAAVWWLTLFISRSAARLETIMQLNYHSPLRPSVSQPSYHPIFHRLKERSSPSSPMSPLSEVPPDTELVWEKRFMKCSYAMFLDHYSYSALSYFLLIKPLIVLFSTIALIALFPVALALVFTLPMYLRAARRWGQWQAGVAIENL